MEYLHDAQVANVITSYATLLGGVLPVLYCLMSRTQPLRWFFVYVCIIITAIPTILHHADMANRSMTIIDIGTNLLLTWSIANALSGDFLMPPARRKLIGVLAAVDLAALGQMGAQSVWPQVALNLSFGDHGFFELGELVLIGNAWLVVAMFWRNRKRIPAAARPFLRLVVLIFLVGMILATASDGHISHRFFAWHAAWHLVGAFGFMTLWVFNHVRFSENPAGAEQPPA